MNPIRSVSFVVLAASIYSCTPQSSGDAGNTGDVNTTTDASSTDSATSDSSSSVMHIDGSGTFHGQPLEVHCHLGDNSLTFTHDWSPPVVLLYCRTADRVDLTIGLTYAQGSGFALTNWVVDDGVGDIRDSSSTDLMLTRSVVVDSWDPMTTAIEGHFSATWSKYHSTTGSTNGMFLNDPGGSITGTFGGVLRSM